MAFTNLKKVKQFTLLLTMSVYLLHQKEFAQYLDIQKKFVDLDRLEQPQLIQKYRASYLRIQRKFQSVLNLKLLQYRDLTDRQILVHYSQQQSSWR